MELWERFSGHARRAVLLAHDETQRAKQQRIGTEHLLLGMLRLGEGMAVDILHGLEVDLAWLRGELRRQLEVGRAEETTSEIAFTPEAQKVLSHAYNEAKNMGQTYIGTEHLLVGLVREDRGAAHRLLKQCGVDLGKARKAVQRRAVSGGEAGEPRGARRAVEQLRRGVRGLEEGLDRLERGLGRRGTARDAREGFGRAVTELAQEAHLDALVLVIGRDGLESCLSTKPRHLRELLEYVKRLLEEEDERREAEGQEEGEEREQDTAG